MPCKKYSMKRWYKLDKEEVRERERKNKNVRGWSRFCWRSNYKLTMSYLQLCVCVKVMYSNVINCLSFESANQLANECNECEWTSMWSKKRLWIQKKITLKTNVQILIQGCKIIFKMKLTEGMLRWNWRHTILRIQCYVQFPPLCYSMWTYEHKMYTLNGICAPNKQRHPEWKSTGWVRLYDAIAKATNQMAVYSKMLLWIPLRHLTQ